MSDKRAGTLELKINGQIQDCVGSFTYNIGSPKREALLGHDRVHGYKELPQTPFIEGEIRDRGDLDIKALQALAGVTVVLKLAVGKSFVLQNAWYAADGDVGSEDGNIQVRFEGTRGEEV
jgi:hypothetical protein